MTDIESLSREFCKLAGICWHEIERRYVAEDIKSVCKKCNVYGFPILKGNPDFSDAREVLKVMDEETRAEFIMWLMGKFIRTGSTSRLGVQGYCVLLTEKYFLDTTGLLLKEAVEFMRREKP